MTSARMLGVILALTFLLSGCFDQSSKQTWDVEPSGGESKFGVPQQIQQKVELANVTAQVELDGIEQGNMVIDGDVGRIRLSNITPGSHTIVVHFYYEGGGSPVPLASATKTVEVIAGQTAKLTILDSDYVFTDTDNDGISNADEIDQGSNYNDANDPIVQGSSSADISSQGVSSSTDGSSSDGASSDNGVSSVDGSSSESAAPSSDGSTSSSLQGGSSSSGNVPTPVFSVSAGDNIQVNEGDLVELTVEVLNAGGPVSYSWTTEAAGLDLQGANTDTLTFQTGNYSSTQTFTFDVSVVSGTQTAQDEVIVTVVADNDAPNVQFVSTRIVVAPNDVVELRPLSVTDPEGETLNVSWVEAMTNPVMTNDFAVSGDTATFTAPTPISLSEPLNLEFVFTADDGVNGVDQTITVVVQDQNQAPIAVITPIVGNTAAENTAVNIDGSQSNDIHTASAQLRYEWRQVTPPATTLDLGIDDWNQSSLSFTSPNLASSVEVTFELVVTDEQNLSSLPETYQLTLQGNNDAPIVVLRASQTNVEANTVITLTAEVSNPDIDQTDIDYTFNWQAPVGFEALFDNLSAAQLASDSIVITTPNLTNDISLTFSVSATENIAAGLESEADDVTINIGQGYFPPVAMAATASGAVEFDEQQTIQLTAQNSMLGTIADVTYQWAATCPGNIAAPAAPTTQLVIANNLQQPVNCEVTLRVSDGQTTSTNVLAITINATNDEPVITVPVAPLPNGMAGISYTLNAQTLNNGAAVVSDSDSPLAALTYEWSAPGFENQITVINDVTQPGVATVTVPTSLFAVDTAVDFQLTVSDESNTVSTPVGDGFTVTFTAVNKNPVAVISDADGAALEGAISLPETELGEAPSQLILDAANSTDDFSEENLRYEWTIGLEETELANYGLSVDQLTDAQITLTAPNLIEPINFDVTLVVVDQQNNRSVATAVTVALDADNDAPQVTLLNPGINGFPLSAAGTTRIGLTVQDPEGFAVSHEWQSADGYPEGLQYLSSATETTPLFTAPLVVDDTVFGFTPVVSDAQGVMAVNPGVIEIPVVAGYLPWDFKLSVISTPPAAAPGFDAIEEQADIVVALEAITQGSSPIQTYDWRGSTCSYSDSAGQPIVSPVVTDFTVFENSAELSFKPITVVARSYSCSIELTIDDGQGTPINRQLTIDVFADNDPAIAEAGVLINNTATSIETLTARAGDEIALTAVQALDPDNNLGATDIQWSIVESTFAAQFSFSDEFATSPILTVPSIPAGAEVTVRLTVNGVFDDIALTVEPLTTPTNPPTIMRISNFGPEAPLANTQISLGLGGIDYRVAETFGSGIVEVTSDNEAVIQIDSDLNRLVTVGPGTAVVTFTELQDDTYLARSVRYTITVNQPVIRVTVGATDVTELSVLEGSQPIDFTVNISNYGRFPRFEASSSNENVATVVFADERTGQIIPGNAAGNATLSFRLIDHPNAAVANVQFTLGELLPRSLNVGISGAGSFVEDGEYLADGGVGANGPITAMPSAGEGSITFSIDNTPDNLAIATIDENTGELTAMGAGTVRVTATIDSDGVYDAASATVEMNIFPRFATGEILQEESVQAGVETTFVIGSAAEDVQFTDFEWSSSTCPDENGNGVPLQATSNGFGSITFTPPSIGTDPYVCNLSFSWREMDGDYLVGIGSFNYELTVTPLIAQIVTAPEEIFDASFAFDIEAEVTSGNPSTLRWEANHSAITFNNQGSLTASMTIDASILDGITRGDEAGRNITLSLFADGREVATHNMRTVLPFVTVWDTAVTKFISNSGSEINSVTPAGELLIGTHPDFSYDYSVDWGDGAFEENVSGDARHQYIVNGFKTVKIIGQFPSLRQFGFGEVLDQESIKLQRVERWGDVQWRSMNYFCYFCVNLGFIDAPDTPDLSSVQDMSLMFTFAENFKGGIGNWDVSKVTTMNRMFLGARAFNEDLNNWKVSSTVDFGLMFYGTESFEGNLSSWQTDSAENMEQMFQGSAFNSDISSWNTSSVISMRRMFETSTNFDQNIGAWDISSVVDMAGIFNNTSLSIEKYDSLLLGWSSQQNIPSNIIFDGGDSQYSAAAAAARQFLTDPNGASWTITDGGLWQPLNVATPDPVNGGSETVFTVTPVEGSAEVSRYDWSASTCPDGAGGTISILENVTNDTTGSATFTPPNFGSMPFVCDIRVEITYADTTTATFTYELIVSPSVSAQIVTAPEEIFDASFAFDIEAEVTSGKSSILRWEANHPAITFNNQGSLTASMTIDASILDGITRGDEAGRNITLSLFADGREVATHNMRIVLPFVTVWDTRATSGSALLGGSEVVVDSRLDEYGLLVSTNPDLKYSYLIDWGDGQYDSLQKGDARHQYIEPGVKAVKIIGQFPHLWQFYSSSSEPLPGSEAVKLISVERWGDIVWESMDRFCFNCMNLESISSKDAPDLSSVESMFGMFGFAAKFNSDIGHWDVSNIKTMDRMFAAANAFNQDLIEWDVSLVTEFQFMFSSAYSFNGNISSWNINTLQSVDMSDMFRDSGFNGNLSTWNTKSVTSMARMFFSAVQFDQDLGSWNISSVQDMTRMFGGANLSRQNYDALLNGWSAQQNAPSDIEFDAGNSQYSAAAADARQFLTDLNGANWTITDGGLWQPLNVATPDPVNGGSKTVFTVTPVEGSAEVSRYDWSASTCPDEAGGTFSILENVTNDTMGSATFTPPNFGSMPFVCDIRVEITYADTTTATFTYELMVSPSVSAQIVTAPNVIFDASFAFDIEAEVTSGNPSALRWEANHPAITFNNQGSLTASMIIDASILEGITRESSDLDRTVTLTLFANEQEIDTVDMRIVLPFVTVWDTRVTSASTSNELFQFLAETPVDSLKISTNSEFTYKYLIDWGDGSPPEAADGAAVHNYRAANIYTVKIVGLFPHLDHHRLDMSSPSDAIKLLSVQRWGDIAWRSMADFCNRCVNLKSINPNDAPNLLSLEDMSGMFMYAENFNSEIKHWEFTNVKYMVQMFFAAEQFNQDLSGWDVSSVIDFGFMFSGAVSLDQNIGAWNISSVESMSRMLNGVMLSTQNYDATLVGWSSQQNIPSNIRFDAGNSQYSAAAAAAKAELESKGWIITDGGLWQPLNVETPDPVNGGSETVFTVTPVEGSAEVSRYDWSASTCPDEAGGTISVLQNVTNDTTGSVTFTPPNFGSAEFECDIQVEITYADGSTLPFSYALAVVPSIELATTEIEAFVGQGTTKIELFNSKRPFLSVLALSRFFRLFKNSVLHIPRQERLIIFNRFRIG